MHLRPHKDREPSPTPEAPQGERRASDITTETLESLSITRRNGHIRVQAHASLTDATRGHDGSNFDAGGVVFSRLHPIPEPSPGLARLGTRRNPRTDRGRSKHRHQGVVARKRIVLPITSASFQLPQDTSRRPCQDPCHVFGLRGRKSHEVSGAMRRSRVDTVEHERMEVGREVQSRPEALDERDRAALRLANSEERSCSSSLVRKDGAQEGPQHVARESRVPGTAIPERMGQREHPLPDRDLGQHPVDEVGCGVGHAAAATGRTEAAALTREGHEPVVAAGVAVDTEESVGQYSALHIASELALDEPSDGGALPSGSGKERDELRANHFVEESPLGLMAGVFGDGRASAGTANP